MLMQIQYAQYIMSVPKPTTNALLRSFFRFVFYCLFLYFYFIESLSLFCGDGGWNTLDKGSLASVKPVFMSMCYNIIQCVPQKT